MSLRSRSLAHYWRTNLAVVLGVATATSVLAGALLLGGSVRASLRDLALARLGRTEHVLRAIRFFREGVADGACPLIALPGMLSHPSGRRASRVLVYGVDERFFRFHGRTDLEAPRGDDAFLSPALAADLQATEGDGLVVRVEAKEAIPAASLFGRKDGPSRALTARMRGVRARSDLGEFALTPTQQAVRAIFLSLPALQRALKQPDRVNTLLVSGPPAGLLAALTPEDMGLRLRLLPDRGVASLESDTTLLDPHAEQAGRQAAAEVGARVEGVFSYLATGLRVGERRVPYSIIAAVEGIPGLRLTDWAARELGARAGERLTLEFLQWDEQGRFLERQAKLRVDGVVPVAAADRDLVPEYPGVTDSLRLSDWDPPFPIDLRRIRPRDEAYWESYRAAPKAYLPLALGQSLFGSRLGNLTSLRVQATSPARYMQALRTHFDPAARGVALEPVRQRALQAAQGATDFGLYFSYFSAFLVGAALLLAGLFFRLGLEQRLREIGLLRAVGFSNGRLRSLFLGEALALALVGAVLGAAGSAAFAALMLLGLRTVWHDAVGTEALRFHFSGADVLAGAVAVVAMSLLVALYTLRGLRHIPARRLLAGEREEPGIGRTADRRGRRRSFLLLIAAGVLVALGAGGAIGEVAAFFGAGLFVLAGLLGLAGGWLRAGGRRPAAGLVALGLRGASYRPGRSLLAISLIASASFVIVAVSAFRRGGEEGPGTGGYGLVAEAVRPIHEDPGPGLVRFRLRDGDDASCLNLYRPQQPRILAPAPAFLEAGPRFPFQASLGRTPEEKANPWRLLLHAEADGTIPVIADANSLAYVLHRRVGEVLTLDLAGRPARLRFVAALQDSLFQGELLMGEGAFLRLFPYDPGYRFFLGEGGPERALALETRYADWGFDAAPAVERLQAFHRVENTYLSTFQTLGGLGLLVGTVGLGTVLARNLLERRRELGLLRAVGYRPGHLATLVLVENLLLLLLGLATGALAAVVAIVPALGTRGGQVPVGALATLLLGVLVTGLLVSAAGLRALRGERLLAALRWE